MISWLKGQMSALDATDLLKVWINWQELIFYWPLKGEMSGAFLVRSEAGAELLSVKTRWRVQHLRVIRSLSSQSSQASLTQMSLISCQGHQRLMMSDDMWLGRGPGWGWRGRGAPCSLTSRPWSLITGQEQDNRELLHMTVFTGGMIFQTLRGSDWDKKKFFSLKTYSSSDVKEIVIVLLYWFWKITQHIWCALYNV